MLPSHRQVPPRPTHISSPCSLNGRSQLPSEAEIWPRHYPLGVGAENGLFQPKLILAPKTPKLTSRPDPPEVGTRQLTLSPSSSNSLEPSPNLVPSEVPASGQHGFVKWGHDAKITKIGVIPTRGSPSQGKANGSQFRRQDLGLISECTT